MNLQVICIPTETQDEINSDSSFDEIMTYIANTDDDADGDEVAVIYDLGQYFKDQNSDNLGLHLSFLVDIERQLVLNGCYNSDL